MTPPKSIICKSIEVEAIDNHEKESTENNLELQEGPTLNYRHRKKDNIHSQSFVESIGGKGWRNNDVETQDSETRPRLLNVKRSISSSVPV